MTGPGKNAPDPASWRPMLLARAVHNTAATVHQDGEDAVRIGVKTIRPWYLVPPLSWIVPVRPERRVVLDRLGLEIWRLCDGVRTVETVADVFAAAHGLTFHEARAAVTGYINSLVRRGVMAVVLPEDRSA